MCTDKWTLWLSFFCFHFLHCHFKLIDYALNQSREEGFYKWLERACCSLGLKQGKERELGNWSESQWSVSGSEDMRGTWKSTSVMTRKGHLNQVHTIHKEFFLKNIHTDNTISKREQRRKCHQKDRGSVHLCTTRSWERCHSDTYLPPLPDTLSQSKGTFLSSEHSNTRAADKYNVPGKNISGAAQKKMCCNILLNNWRSWGLLNWKNQIIKLAPYSLSISQID